MLTPARKPFPVVITIDVDAEAGVINRDRSFMDRPTSLAAGRYGPQVGLPRILRLLKKYDIRATLFVPGWVAERYSDTMKAAIDEGHEIAHHGYLHEWLFNLDEQGEREVLVRGLDAIEKVTGHRPMGYRAPAWHTTNHTYGLLAEYGFEYSSNMMDSDDPYRVQVGEAQLAELPVAWSLDDSSLYMYGHRLPGASLEPNEVVLSLWQGEFDALYRAGAGCCVLTVHPELTGRPYRTEALETFLKNARAHAGVEFVRGVDLARATLADSGARTVPNVQFTL